MAGGPGWAEPEGGPGVGIMLSCLRGRYVLVPPGGGEDDENIYAGGCRGGDSDGVGRGDGDGGGGGNCSGAKAPAPSPER